MVLFEVRELIIHDRQAHGSHIHVEHSAVFPPQISPTTHPLSQEMVSLHGSIQSSYVSDSRVACQVEDVCRAGLAHSERWISLARAIPIGAILTHPPLPRGIYDR